MTEHGCAVMSAPDHLETILEFEAITEPLGLSKGMIRPTLVEHRSASIGYRVLERILYMNPPLSPAWGGEGGREYNEEAL